MDEGSPASVETRTDAAAPAIGRSRRTRRAPARDLAILAVIGVLLLAALGAGGVTLYREFYSPTAFVMRYLDLLAEGRAADALAVPGVASADASGAEASDALLRRAALTTLDEIRPLAEEADGDVTRVTVGYRAGAVDGKTTFEVSPSASGGMLPSWRFSRSPLATIDLTVRGSMQFAVNGFEIDKRQVSPDGAAADPLAALSMLVFSPGLYSVAVDTAISASPGVAVLADAPAAGIPVDIQAEATDKFVAVVQQEVEQFLTDCATQQVLQPTGCPFGFEVRNRIVDLPAWSIVQQPTVTVAPDGAGWRIVPAEAVAHIDVKIRSLFDGSIREVAEDVTFAVGGSIEVQPDGAASISVTGEPVT